MRSAHQPAEIPSLFGRWRCGSVSWLLATVHVPAGVHPGTVEGRQGLRSHGTNVATVGQSVSRTIRQAIQGSTMPVPRCASAGHVISAPRAQTAVCHIVHGELRRWIGNSGIIRNGRPIVGLCVENSPARLPYYLVLDATGSRPENSRGSRVPSEDLKSGRQRLVHANGEGFY
jgi:hypothetical protein